MGGAFAGALEALEQRALGDLDGAVSDGEVDADARRGGGTRGCGGSEALEVHARPDECCHELHHRWGATDVDLARGEIRRVRTKGGGVEWTAVGDDLHGVIESGRAWVSDRAEGGERRELGGEDGIGVAARGLHDDDVPGRAPRDQVAHDGRDRCDAAAGADQEQLGGRGHRERPGGRTESHDRANDEVLVHPRRHAPAGDGLDRDLDRLPAGLGAARRDRVATAHAHALDLDLDRYVLPGDMAGPGARRGERERLRIGGLGADPAEPRALFNERPRRAQLAEPELGRAIEKPAPPRRAGDGSGARTVHRAGHLDSLQLLATYAYVTYGIVAYCQDSVGRRGPVTLATLRKRSKITA